MSTKSKNLFPEVIYEDKNYLVINKPAGISVHPSEQEMLNRQDERAVQNPTISDLILAKYPKMKDVGEPMEVNVKNQTMTIMRPGIVHRIDKDTSGCLIIAKNQESFLSLKKQFMEHTVDKTYRAFTYGTPAEDSGTINVPIGRSRAGVRKWSTGNNARGEMRDAITKYKVLARIGMGDRRAKGSTDDGTYAYIEAIPKTGRTHQIRVHMKYLNHPIVCDNLYATNHAPALGFERLALHAYQVAWTGMDGNRITVTAPFPKDFAKAVLVAESVGLC